MLHKCANPACPHVFRSLRHGKLFLLQTVHAAGSLPNSPTVRRGNPWLARVERYWLCESCSQLLTLTFEREGGW
jgi:hypothetical protein